MSREAWLVYAQSILALSEAARDWNKANAAVMAAYERGCKPPELVEAERIARERLDRCIADQGAPP